MASTKPVVKYRLGGLSVAILLAAAVMGDVITLILPGIGAAVGPAFGVCVSIFLYLKGFGILNARRLSTSIIATVGEMIPVVQAMPMILAGIIALIAFTRIEDRAQAPTHPKINAYSQGRREPGPGKQEPLNNEGVRQPSGHIARV